MFGHDLQATRRPHALALYGYQLSGGLLTLRMVQVGFGLNYSVLCRELGPLPALGVFDRGAGGFSGIRARFMHVHHKHFC